MADNNKDISVKFFGLNKQDVDNYLSKLQKEQKQKLDEILNVIKQLNKEKEKLIRELENVKKEEVRFEDVVEDGNEASDEVTDTAKKRVEKTVALINMLADEEAEQIVNKAKQKISEYEGKIEGLQEEINENKQKIDSIFKDVLKLLKANVEAASEDDNSREKAKNADNVTVLNKFNRISSQNKSEFEDDEDNEIEEKVSVKNRKEGKITADGSSISDIEKLILIQKKYTNKPEDGVEITMLQQLYGKGKKKSKTDDYLEMLEEENKKDDLFFEGEYDEQENEFEEEVNETEAQKAEVVSPKPKKTPPITMESAADINQMRRNLIIGKMAGEDLMDSENNVIIPKNKILTEEDIKIAEKASKLPELIINMVLPK